MQGVEPAEDSVSGTDAPFDDTTGEPSKLISPASALEPHWNRESYKQPFTSDSNWPKPAIHQISMNARLRCIADIPRSTLNDSKAAEGALGFIPIGNFRRH